MRLENFNFFCSNNFLLLHLNSDGIEDDNIQSLGHGLSLVKRRKLFTLCKIQSQWRNSAWGAKYPIGNMGTYSVHPSPSGSDCDDNSVIPVSLDAVVDIVNAIVDAGPTVCSTSHKENIYREKP